MLEESLDLTGSIKESASSETTYLREQTINFHEPFQFHL